MDIEEKTVSQLVPGDIICLRNSPQTLWSIVLYNVEIDRGQTLRLFELKLFEFKSNSVVTAEYYSYVSRVVLKCQP